MSDNQPAIWLPQDTQIDQYRIQRLINRRKYTAVYRAHHPKLNRDIALKLFKPVTPPSPELTATFQQEAQRIVTLKHPNIIRFFDYGAYRDMYYVVMEWITGASLRDSLSAQPSGLDRNDSLRIFSQIARAVAYAHEQDLVHGNIKPDNVLLDAGQRPILTDFSIPCLNSASHAPTTSSSQRAAAYLSPQQAQGQRPSPACDIYVLGILLYEMATGNVPFRGRRHEEILQQHLSTEPVPPSQVRIDIDPRIETVALKALSKQPEDRYASVRDMIAGLEQTTTVAARYDTLAIKRPSADQLRKSRSEIRKFERSRAIDVRDMELNPPEPQASQQWSLVLGVALGIIIVALLAAIILLV